ncbi:orotate phosphoribosyltransferase [Thermococcus gammatolerans]|uniref:Orotate phosphoribosyltransferase n=1 Tax=Thermococcus gammatolerans (strain DSM 15229 / JCM 11827 / EJ3) TaxID=593117 RepID=PYRE_THEGJ|nr:orotate phosphoribosyltransferase [Thermococcus gammatolerans]C5A1Y3.1 RecName: Full=Orotate phosphoribosyltransferase; Short=OPRT; Short=OPRTase [Thermococcus gammatolerans EJ3]ACS34402.1 Orotate phosphoribosyltransferase (pyrE) [Thermococcus gammatolerans EJ3]
MIEAKDRLIDKMLESGAILFGHFVLSSGKESDYYINVKKVVTDPDALELMAGLIAGLVQRVGIDFDRVAGPELGAVPIATAVSLKTGKPLVIVRKKPKGYGTGSQIEGDVKEGDRILLVEDVTTTGGSVLRAAEVLESLGARIAAIAVVVDREEGAEGSITSKGYTFLPVIRVSELLERKETVKGRESD